MPFDYLTPLPSFASQQILGGYRVLSTDYRPLPSPSLNICQAKPPELIWKLSSVNYCFLPLLNPHQ